MKKLCINGKRNINIGICDIIIPVCFRFVKKKTLPPCWEGVAKSLLAEGLAVGALVLSGVHLVGTHQNPVQRAVVLILAMVCALLNSTLDTLIGMTVHKRKPPFVLGSEIVWRK